MEQAKYKIGEMALRRDAWYQIMDIRENEGVIEYQLHGLPFWTEERFIKGIKQRS